MRDKEKATAERFGIYDKCLALENDLLKIEGVAFDEHHSGIPFDLDGFYDDKRQRYCRVFGNKAKQGGIY